MTLKTYFLIHVDLLYSIALGNYGALYLLVSSLDIWVVSRLLLTKRQCSTLPWEPFLCTQWDLSRGNVCEESWRVRESDTQGCPHSQNIISILTNLVYYIQLSGKWGVRKVL